MTVKKKILRAFENDYFPPKLPQGGHDYFRFRYDGVEKDFLLIQFDNWLFSNQKKRVECVMYFMSYKIKSNHQFSDFFQFSFKAKCKIP